MFRIYKNVINGILWGDIRVDKICRNRDNINYCKEHGIKIIGPALGTPKKNIDKVGRKQEYIDSCEK